MILVTGGDGFLGNHLVDYLNINNHEVVSTTRNKNVIRSNKNRLFVDFTKKIDEKKISDNFEIIIHTAGISQKDCRNNKFIAESINTNSAIELAKIALKKSIKKFIYFSTVHVYGQNLIGNISEKSKLNPFDNYSMSKLNAERELSKIFANTEVNLIILRLSNIFGAPLNYSTNIWHLIGPHLCNQIYQKKRMELFSNGKQVRDFLGIQEFLKIVLKLVKKDFNKCNVIYNCGSGMPTTIQNFAELIKKRYLQIFSEEAELILGSDDSDKSYYNLNIEKLVSEVGIIPKKDLISEIDNFLKFISEHKS